MYNLKEMSNDELISLKKSLGDKVQRLSNMEQALKIVLNSGYGAVSNQYFRFFDLNNAEAITATGQIVIQWVMRDINKYLNETMKTNIDWVIGADTDSLLISLQEVTNKLNMQKADKGKVIDILDNFCKKRLSKVIEDSIATFMEYTNAYQPKLFMKREALADKGLWRAKKNYVLSILDQEGVRYAEPKMKIVGLEIVRSNTPKACRDALKHCLKLIISGTKQELLDYVDEFREKYMKLEFMDIASPTSVNGITKYDRAGSHDFQNRTPRHVKGSLIYNELIEKHGLLGKYKPIYESDKIKFLTLKQPNPIQYDVISIPFMLPKEFDLEKFIDYDGQFNKTFIEPLKSIAELVGWDVEEKATLDAFF